MSTYIKHNAGKFFLMENCPDKSAYIPDYDNFERYNKALQSIPAIEIINPEVFENNSILFKNAEGYHSSPFLDGGCLLKDNDTFLLPETIGYEIEEVEIPCPDNIEGCEVFHFKKVARLYVKADKGETQEEMIDVMHKNAVEIHDSKVIIDAVKELVDKYWRFDNNQQHLSTWHDKQDLLKKIESMTNQ